MTVSGPMCNSLERWAGALIKVFGTFWLEFRKKKCITNGPTDRRTDHNIESLVYDYKPEDINKVTTESFSVFI